MSKEKGKKPCSRRSRTKYPALTRKMNLKSRQYYIEAEYINGVRGVVPDSSIRPLTEKEKEFLNKFYEEYIITSFKKDATDLHQTITIQAENGEDLVLNQEEARRYLYKQNNHRNFDLYNLKLKTGQLDSFNSDTYDKIVYDNLNHIDFEEALTNQIEIKETAQIIVDSVDQLGMRFGEIETMVRKRFPEYFNMNFTEKELKEMKKNKNMVGETLYTEAKIILET